jgi:hypothetical protein
VVTVRNGLRQAVASRNDQIHSRTHVHFHGLPSQNRKVCVRQGLNGELSVAVRAVLMVILYMLHRYPHVMPPCESTP